MSEVSDPARALGLGGAYAAPDGSSVPVSSWKYGVQAEYAKYLRDRAVATVREIRDLLTPEEYKAQLAEVSCQYVAGKFSFGGELMLESLNLKENLAHLFWLQARVAAEKARRPEPDYERLRALVDADAAGVLDALTAANADPTTPPATTTGTPAAAS